MRKQLEDFLMDIAEFYPIPTTKSYDKVISLSVDYLIEYCEGKYFDFKKARHALFEKYKFKGFPDLATIKECLREGEIQLEEHCKDEGGLAVVTIPNYGTYTFIISPAGRSVDEIKKQISFKYGNDYTMKIYPQGTVMIGDKIFESK